MALRATGAISGAPYENVKMKRTTPAATTTPSSRQSARQPVNRPGPLLLPELPRNHLDCHARGTVACLRAHPGFQCGYDVPNLEAPLLFPTRP